jgi:hypothetical protein
MKQLEKHNQRQRNVTINDVEKPHVMYVIELLHRATDNALTHI